MTLPPDFVTFPDGTVAHEATIVANSATSISRRLRSAVCDEENDGQLCEDAADAIDRLSQLLSEAGEMWAFSTANLTRGHFDCEWNEKRIALLTELHGEGTIQK